MQLQIISAGAGSGKTYRLTQEMVALLQEGLSAEGIIATTFTKKAATELQERVRVALLNKGLTTAADDLTNALIGTVHSLGGKLLKRFAFEAGVSPQVSIIGEGDFKILFNQSLSAILNKKRVETMDELCNRLGLNKREYYDWRQDVARITEIARANEFDREILEKSRQKSFESFQEFLGVPSENDSNYFNERLLNLLEETIREISAGEDTTNVTQGVLRTLKAARSGLKMHGYLPWYQWAQISKLKPGAKSRDAVEEIKNFAALCHRNPQMHKDIQAYIYRVFDIAIEAIEEYSSYKKRRGLIDYTDMETLVNRLLDKPVIQEVLKEELSLLMVDEFQDTSPIQLSIFLKLSKLAKHSIWVGDPKQSIYGFRGAEPRLMQAIIDYSGGIRPENIQRFSWRSREDIVGATNALFTKAFSDIPPEQVVLQPKYTKMPTAESITDEPESSLMSNALKHWHFNYAGEGRKPSKSWVVTCLAHTLKSELEKGMYILPKGEKEHRLARPNDVAILCRSNATCRQVGEAINEVGLEVAIARSGLLETAEIRLILACLRYILNGHDALAVAEILLFAKGEKIENILEDRIEWVDQSAVVTSEKRWGQDKKIIAQLDELRPQMSELSSVEILNLLLTELDMRRIITALPNAEQRLDNIEMLRKLALEYEQACTRLHTAASLGGFQLWLADLERQDTDWQALGRGEHAVNILTYHKSKGLEWPIVICFDLDGQMRSDVFGVEIIPETETVNIDDVLSGRWLRFWVNPYADQKNKTQLFEQIEASEAKQSKIKQSLQEEARLLYVGITRARDYIVFPSAHQPMKWLNRIWHEGREDLPVLDPDSKETPWEWQGEFLPIDSQIFDYEREFETSEREQQHQPVYWAVQKGKKNHPAYYLDTTSVDFPLATIAEVLYYHPPLVCHEEQSGALHQVMDALLCGYTTDLKASQKTEQCEWLLRHVSDEALDIESGAIIEQVDAFFADFLPENGQLYKKVPLQLEYQKQWYHAILDMLIISENRINIFYHSGISGEEKLLKKSIAKINSIIHLNSIGVARMHPGYEVRSFVHFVLDGVVMEVVVFPAKGRKGFAHTGTAKVRKD